MYIMYAYLKEKYDKIKLNRYKKTENKGSGQNIDNVLCKTRDDRVDG